MHMRIFNTGIIPKMFLHIIATRNHATFQYCTSGSCNSRCLTVVLIYYRMAAKGNLPSVQLSALENMHYSHMIRFDNAKEAK